MSIKDFKEISNEIEDTGFTKLPKKSVTGDEFKRWLTKKDSPNKDNKKNVLYIEMLESHINLIKENKTEILTLTADSMLLRQREIRDFLNKNKTIFTKVNLVISSPNVLIKQITVPKMSKKNLNSFILNNIENYFTFDNKKHEYTYRITNIRKIESKVHYDLLLYAIPKTFIEDIRYLKKRYGLKFSKVDIFSEILYMNYKGQGNIAVIELGKDKVDFLSMNNDEFFMYTTDEINQNDDYQERLRTIAENITNYLNFHTVRHFGEDFDKIYLLSSSDFQSLKELSIMLNKSKTEIICPETEKSANRIDSFKLSNNHNNDSIKKFILKENNLDKPLENKKNQHMFILKFIILLLLVGFIFGAPFINKQLLIKKERNIGDILNQYSQIIEAQNELNLYQNSITSKKAKMKAANKNNIDFLKIINIIENKIPPNIKCNTLTISDNFNTVVVFSIPNTESATQLITALRSMDLFETVPVDTVNIDDKEQQISFNLIIKKDKQQEFIIGDKW